MAEPEVNRCYAVLPRLFVCCPLATTGSTTCSTTEVLLVVLTGMLALHFTQRKINALFFYPSASFCCKWVKKAHTTPLTLNTKTPLGFAVHPF
jgi:hypothetical protein